MPSNKPNPTEQVKPGRSVLRQNVQLTKTYPAQMPVEPALRQVSCQYITGFPLNQNVAQGHFTVRSHVQIKTPGWLFQKNEDNTKCTI